MIRKEYLYLSDYTNEQKGNRIKNGEEDLMKILFVSRKYDQIVGGVERMSIALMNETWARFKVLGLAWELPHD